MSQNPISSQAKNATQLFWYCSRKEWVDACLDMNAYLNEMVSMGSEADRMRTSLRARGI